MPNKDGTGPEGKGPRTGRQLGKCENVELQNSLGQGKDFGRRCNKPRRCQRNE